MTIHTGPYWSSDHLPVFINVNLDISPPNIPNPNWKFADEKWYDWNEMVSNSLTENKLRDSSSPEEAYNTFYTSIINASKELFAPNKNPLPKESPKPWWTPQCKKATSAARRAYNKWRSTLLQTDKIELNRLEAIKRKTIMKAKNESWTKYIDSLDHPGNTSVFWNFAKAIINGKKTQHVWPNLIDASNHQLTTPMEKANALLDHFCPNTT
jgi:hypothetical protein